MSKIYSKLFKNVTMHFGLSSDEYSSYDWFIKKYNYIDNLWKLEFNDDHSLVYYKAIVLFCEFDDTTLIAELENDFWYYKHCHSYNFIIDEIVCHTQAEYDEYLMMEKLRHA